MHLNEFIDLDEFQEVIDFGPSFCFFFRKVRCPIVEKLIIQILFLQILYQFAD